MRPVVLSCLVVVFGHIHLVTAGPFPSRHPVDLLRPQCASKTCVAVRKATRRGLEDGLRRDSIQSHNTTCGSTAYPHGVQGAELVTKRPDRGHNY